MAGPLHPAADPQLNITPHSYEKGQYDRQGHPRGPTEPIDTVQLRPLSAHLSRYIGSSLLGSPGPERRNGFDVGGFDGWVEAGDEADDGAEERCS